jgi:hypothetical protein
VKLPIRLPTELLSAHDKGRLVFFCGAGISRYTGLGDFKGLVEDIFAMCGLPLFPEASCATCGQVHPSEIGTRSPEEDAFHRGAYDRALHLLEAKSDYMRPAAVEVLGAPSSDPDLKTHKALLSLSRHPEGGHRLVTTNFDRRFEEAEPNLEFQAGPYLTLPRPESWRRLTYLHGRLDPARDPGGNGLVLTSGDFSRAYLQDGWAARFALHLFESYTILFVGYSLNDPVVSYLIDGLAADMRRRGESLNAYILADHDGTEAGRRTVEMTWESRGLIPIPFDRKDDFAALHQTLHCWAEIDTAKRDRQFETVLEPLFRPYDPKTTGTAELELLLWLLSADNGAIADAFADADPPPDISWLTPIAETKLNLPIAKGSVSLLNLPSPGEHIAPLAGPGAANLPELTLSPVTLSLGRWLARHRDKKEMVDWVIRRGGCIHPSWARLLERDLDKVAEPFASFWRIVLDPAIHQPTLPIQYPFGVSDGKWPPEGDLNLLKAARPYLKINKGYSFMRGESVPPEIVPHLAQFELKIFDYNYILEIWTHRECTEIREALLRNASALTERMVDGVRLTKYISEINVIVIESLSLIYPESIRYEGFSTLLCLCIAAFEAARENHPALAEALARRWLALAQVEKLALFPRMALHALAYVQPIPVDEELSLLLGDDGRLLWDSDAAEELELYLGQRVPSLPSKARDSLVEAIFNGPTKRAYSAIDWKDEDFLRFASTQRNLRLGMLADAGIPLPDHLAQMAEEARGKWVNERPIGGILECHHPVSAQDSGLLDLSDEQIVERVCTAHSEIAGFDGWSDLCANHVDRALMVLPFLAERCPGSSRLWDELTSFREVKEERRRLEILQTLDTVFSQQIDHFGQSLLLSISRVLRAFAPSVPAQGEARIAFLTLWQATWNAALTDGQSIRLNHSEGLEAAMNAPGGILAKAALHLVLREKGQIPPDIMPLLELMVTGDTLSHRYSHIILASRLGYLHQRADNWVKQHLITRMKWPHPESIPMWQGFFESDRTTIPSMADLHDAFLSVAGMLEEREGRSNWNHILIETAVAVPEVFTSVEISRLMKNATGTDLGQMAWQLARHLDRAADKAPIQWQDTIRPIICQHWPSTIAQRTSASIESLVELAIAAKSAFPDAIALMLKRKLIGAVEGALPTFFSLHPRSEAIVDPCKDYPETVLSILDAVVTEDVTPDSGFSIKQSLDRIVAADPKLAQDERMRRLCRRLS